MTPEYVRALSRYNRWINEKLYTVAAQLSDEERKRDRGAFFKSIHATLNHLLVADRIWMGRLTGAKLEADWMGPGGIRSLDQELHTDFIGLRSARAATDAEIDDWARQQNAELLMSQLHYLSRNVPFDYPRWWAVGQMFNHQTHHRGQVTTLLMQAGGDPGVTDLFAMLREEKA